MSSLSTRDEIDAIERSAQGQSLSQNNNNEKTNIKSSSMGSVDTFDSANYDHNDLVVSFPSQNKSQGMNGTLSGGPGAPKHRNSITLNPVAMKGLADFNDSDFDDSDDEDSTPKKAPPAPTPRTLSNPKASGGPEHRPLVGGFAAAAYEAARMDHYKQQGVEVRGPNPPRPRSHYPGYP